MNLTPYDVALLISILAGNKDPRDCNDDEADMLNTFCDELELKSNQADDFVIYFD